MPQRRQFPVFSEHARAWMSRSSPPCSARVGMAARAAQLNGSHRRPQIADPRRPFIYSCGGSKHAKATYLRRPRHEPSSEPSSRRYVPPRGHVLPLRRCRPQVQRALYLLMLSKLYMEAYQQCSLMLQCFSFVALMYFSKGELHLIRIRCNMVVKEFRYSFMLVDQTGFQNCRWPSLLQMFVNIAILYSS